MNGLVDESTVGHPPLILTLWHQNATTPLGQHNPTQHPTSDPLQVPSYMASPFQVKYNQLNPHQTGHPTPTNSNPTQLPTNSIQPSTPTHRQQSSPTLTKTGQLQPTLLNTAPPTTPTHHHNGEHRPSHSTYPSALPTTSEPTWASTEPTDSTNAASPSWQQTNNNTPTLIPQYAFSSPVQRTMTLGYRQRRLILERTRDLSRAQKAHNPRITHNS